MLLHYYYCNESKTEFVLLGKSSSLEKLVFDPEIRFGDTVLQPMECRGKTGKTLGILLDEHLTLERQVNNVKKQCGLQLKNLWQLNKCLDNSTRILLVKQLVISKILDRKLQYPLIRTPKTDTKKSSKGSKLLHTVHL